jgi:hypothetical protein
MYFFYINYLFYFYYFANFYKFFINLRCCYYDDRDVVIKILFYVDDIDEFYKKLFVLTLTFPLLLKLLFVCLLI